MATEADSALVFEVVVAIIGNISATNHMEYQDIYPHKILKILRAIDGLPSSERRGNHPRVRGVTRAQVVEALDKMATDSIVVAGKSGTKKILVADSSNGDYHLKRIFDQTMPTE